MKLSAIAISLTLMNAASAVSFGTPTSLISRQLDNSLTKSLNTTGVQSCLQSDCQEMQDRTKPCGSIIEGKSSQELVNDEQTSIKFDNCLCDGYDYIKENQTCSDCLENAQSGLGDDLNQFCELVDSNPKNPRTNGSGGDNSGDEDGPSGSTKALPSLSLASLVLVALGVISM